MVEIAYIEPIKNLIMGITTEPHLQVNLNIMSRINGIHDAVYNNGDISLNWFNNQISIPTFFSSGEYLRFDGLVMTAPSPEVYPLILESQKKKPIVVSTDFPPLQGINYIGPDLTHNLKKMLLAINEEGNKEISFIVKHNLPATKILLEEIERLYKTNQTALLQENVIGFDLKKKQCKLDKLSNFDFVKTVTDEMVRINDKKRVFLFLDSGTQSTVYTHLVRTHRLRIPEDIKIASMEDIGLFPTKSEYLASKISRIRKNYYELGVRSIDCLYDIIQGKRPSHSNTILVPGIFIKGITMASKIPIEDNNYHFKKTISLFIADNFNKKISVKSICKEMEMNYNYFVSKFKACFGQPIGDYVNQVRLDKAATLLTASRKEITAIYLSVGFTSKSTFIRQFRKRFDKSPTDYRRSAL